MQNIAEQHEQVYAHLTTKYPDLTFSLRADNRDGALEKGYWFEGDENELRFTFWKSDILERPLVYLKWHINGMLTLCIDLYQKRDDLQISTDIMTFIDEFAKNFPIRERMLNKTEYWELNLKYDSLPFSNPIIELDAFVDNSSGNSLLQILQDIVPKKQNLKQELFYGIPQSDFQKSKALIEGYRSKQPIKKNIFEYKNTKLLEVNLENIRHISPVDIEFHNNLTCFIGLNGTGKTTLLQAIALGAVGYADDVFLKNPLQQDKLGWFLQMEMDEKSRLPVFKEHGSIDLAYHTDGIFAQHSIDFRGLHQKSIIRTSIFKFPQIQHSNGYYKTLILGFPQVKGKTKIDMSDARTDLPNLYDCSSLINGETDDRFKNVQRWFFSLYNEGLNQMQKQEIPFKQTKEKQVLDFTFDIISEIMGQKIYLQDTKYYGEDELTWLNIDGKPELMSLTSQGFESVMTWVGYLIQRLYDIQPNTPYTHLTDIPAIVLIDEIDTYLHISVQQKILAVLVEKFPNVQFIVTTHSPYTIGSIPNDKIKIYVCKKEGESVEVEEFTDFTAYGADIKELSKRISGIERSATEVELAFKALFNLLDEFEENPHDAVLENSINYQIENIEKQIHHSDPELLEAKNKLILIKILNEEEEGSTV